jgi:hypothetical protein
MPVCPKCKPRTDRKIMRCSTANPPWSMARGRPCLFQVRHSQVLTAPPHPNLGRDWESRQADPHLHCEFSGRQSASRTGGDIFGCRPYVDAGTTSKVFPGSQHLPGENPVFPPRNKKPGGGSGINFDFGLIMSLWSRGKPVARLVSFRCPAGQPGRIAAYAPPDPPI